MKNLFSIAKRLRIYKRDHYICWYCGKQLSHQITTDNLNSLTVTTLALIPTIDHLEPRIQGGYDLDENLVTSCRSCNSQKGKKTVEEYREFLALSTEPAGQSVASWIRNEPPVIFFWGERKRAA